MQPEAETETAQEDEEETGKDRGELQLLTGLTWLACWLSVCLDWLDQLEAYLSARGTTKEDIDDWWWHIQHMSCSLTQTHTNSLSVPPALSHSLFRVFIALTLEGTDGFGTLSNHKFKVCHLWADRQRLWNKASVSGQMRLQPSSLPSHSLHPAVSPSTKMQMNDATEPLKIIIGAAVTTAAAQRKIYFLIFNGVNAYRKTKKRNTKKQKKKLRKKQCKCS